MAKKKGQKKNGEKKAAKSKKAKKQKRGWQKKEGDDHKHGQKKGDGEKKIGRHVYIRSRTVILTPRKTKSSTKKKRQAEMLQEKQAHFHAEIFRKLGIFTLRSSGN